MAIRAPLSPAATPATAERSTPSEFVRAAELATQRYLEALARDSAAPGDALLALVAQQAQATIGNAATAALLEPGDTAAGPPESDERDEQADRLREREEARREEEDEDRLPDPGGPEPADPAEGELEDEEEHADDRPPPHEPAAAEEALPEDVSGGGTGAGTLSGGARPAIPAGGGAAGIVQATIATATAMPGAPAASPGGTRAAPRRTPRRPPTRRRIAGPPPVPTLEPDFAGIPDKTQEQTKEIDLIAGRALSRAVMPPVPPSPGENTVTVPDRAISAADLRLVTQGEPGMDRAELSRTSEPPLPGEREGGETRTRLLALRNQLLNPESAAGEGAPAEGAGATAPPAPQTATPVTPPAPAHQSAEQADAEALAPGSFAVESTPLPPADMTVAEQEMFTAVAANLKAGGRDGAMRTLDEIKGEMPEYPGRVLTRDSPPALGALGKDLLPGLEQDMDGRVNGIAGVLGTAGAALDAAVAERRAALDRTADARTAGIVAGARLDLLTIEGTAQARLDDAAAARAQATEARRRASAAGRAPDLGFRQIADGNIRRIQARVSEAIARFQFARTERDTELDNAKARWMSAVDLAVIADRFDVEREHGLQPGATRPPNISAAARRAINRAVNRATAWRTEQQTFIDREILALKGAAGGETALNITDVQNAGAAAFRALRDWGNSQDGATEQWWQDRVAELNGWADNAEDTANTWAETESRLARLQMQRAAQFARARIERQLQANEAEYQAYLALTEGERRNFIARNIRQSDQLIEAVGEPIRTSVIDANKASISQQVEAELFALPQSEWPALNAAARAENSSFDAERKANRIYAEGYDKTGTGEKAIFDELLGLRHVEMLALTGAYNVAVAGRPNALYNDLDDEMSGDEWRRAEALLRERHGEAAAEAVHDAVFGPGTGEPQIYQVLEALNRLPEPQRTRELARADATYQERYGESLSSRLRGDLSGAERDRALALAAGDVEAARAHRMGYALSSRDPDEAAAVYNDIRSELMERARTEGWDPTRYEAEVAQRNQTLAQNFEQHYADVPNYNWGSGTALENAIGYQFAFSEGNRDRLNALAAGDLTGVSAGHMRAEQRSNYADDEVMGNIVVDQQRYAAQVVELERGPEMRAGISRRIARKVRRREEAGDPVTAEWIANERMRLERDMQISMADAAFDRARHNVAALDARLNDRYGIDLDTMISNTMSDNVFGDGGDLTNARARLEIMRRDSRDPAALADRRIDWAYSRIRFGIEGAGTDMDELRGGLSGLTKEEIGRLDARWKGEHGNETLREAIQSDTSGREEDDLIDLFDHGAPMTVADQVDELRRRLDRDEASVGSIGAWASERHSARSHERVAELEAMLAEMRRPDLSPDQRENLMAGFTEQRTSVENAIEAQRARVDAYADMVTTVLSYVVSAIVIAVSALLTVASGGTLSFALAGAIALAGSLIGTVSGIAAKAAIKGGAYGAEELGTDIAVGLVDLAVTAATAGLFKGGALVSNARALFAGAMEEVKVIGRQALRLGFRQVGQQALRQTAGQVGRQALGGLAREGGETGLMQGLRRAGREFALDQAQSIPTTLTGQLLNEQNWRHGNVAGNVLGGTWEGTLQNLRDSVIMGAGSHALTRGLGRMVHPDLTGLQMHERDVRHWRHAHLDASPGDFARFVEAYVAANSEYGDIVRQAQRAARRELLAEIPPRERGAVADVPIIHVNELQFRLYNNGNFGDAIVHVRDGQAVIIIRDGAPASAIREIGPRLREIVAPGTRGRTVNPAESLPSRLRNRVPVEVVSDPAFGADEVRAVPRRDRDGNIIGVALQVGPNARAIDIQQHVGTVDAMRRYAGLAGEIRLTMNRLGRGMGVDIVDPSQLGRWEAQLEIAKLPAIIEERMTRLSERGLDPRRRALVMGEIASLERQFMRELDRASMGAAAEERGYVAAKPQEPDATAEANPAPLAEGIAAVPADREHLARLRGIINDMRGEQARLADLDRQLLDAQPTGYTKFQNLARSNRASYAAALGRLVPHLPPNLQPLAHNAGSRRTPDIAAQYAELSGRPEFREALSRLGKRDRSTIERVGGYLERIQEFHQERGRLEGLREQGEANLARLQAEFREVGGNAFLGVELHPDLPDRRAPVDYRPEYAFEPKFREILGDQVGRQLMEAILDRMEYGQSDAFTALARDPGVQKAFGDKTLEKVFEQVLAHRQGYRAEMALASRIADGFPELPGQGPHTVVDFGDPIGANHADVISVDAAGNVFLWDSKYRGEGSAGLHSETFSDSVRRGRAEQEALEIIKDPARSPNLSDAAREAARRNLEAGTFYAITSHTNDVFSFRDSPPMRIVHDKVQTSK